MCIRIISNHGRRRTSKSFSNTSEIQSCSQWYDYVSLLIITGFLIVCLQSGSPCSPTPKGKALDCEQRFSVECGDDQRSPIDTGMIEISSSELTLGISQRFVDLQGGLISCIIGTTCGTVHVPPETLLPTSINTQTIQAASIAASAVQLPPEDLFTDGNVPACQTTSIAGRLSDLPKSPLQTKSHTDTSNCITSLASSLTEAKVTLRESKSTAPSRLFSAGLAPALELDQLGFECDSSNGPTPQGDGTLTSLQDLHFNGDNIDPDEMFDDSNFVVGRPSEAILDMIQEGLDHIDAYLTDLVAHSGQPPQQVIDCFLKQHTRSNPTNDWNSYSKYFTHYTEQELARLWKTREFTGSVDSTPCKGTLDKSPYSN